MNSAGAIAVFRDQESAKQPPAGRYGIRKTGHATCEFGVFGVVVRVSPVSLGAAVPDVDFSLFVAGDQLLAIG